MVDWARACYRGTWRLFAGRPDILTRGYYYFADEGVTPYYPGEHNFTNADWHYSRDEPYVAPDLGEDRSLRRGFYNGALLVPRPPAVQLGSAHCISGGEPTYPGSERRLPMGVDERCYPPGMAPVFPPAGMFIWHRPEGLPAGSDGDPISSWKDDSGNKNVPVQGINPRRPTLETVGLGGLPAAVFYAAGSLPKSLVYGVDAEGVQHPLSLGSEYSVYIVGTTDDTFPTVAGPSIGVDVFPATSPLAVGQGTVIGGTDTNTVTVASVVGNAESHVWSVRNGGGTMELSVDGAVVGAAAVDPSGESTIGGLIAYITVVAARRRCKFSEVIVYLRRVDDANHSATVSYLRAKYGL